MGGHCPADGYRRRARTGECARWERSAPDERLGWAPDAPSSPVLPVESEAAPCEEAPAEPAEARPAVETGAEAAPRTLAIEEVLALRLFLHPRGSIRAPHACDFTVTHPAASRFLTGRPIQCDDRDALAAN
jgi:hypothetical protein